MALATYSDATLFLAANRASSTLNAGINDTQTTIRDPSAARDA